MFNICDLINDGFQGEALAEAEDLADHGLDCLWSLAIVGRSFVQLVAWTESGRGLVIIIDRDSLAA